MTFNKEQLQKLEREIFGDILYQSDFDTLDTLQNSRKAEFVLGRGSLSENEIAKRIAEVAKVEFVEDFEVAENAENIVPLKIINAYSCLPLADGRIATSWLPTEETSKWIVAEAHIFPEWVIVPTNKLYAKLSERFGVGADTLEGNKPKSSIVKTCAF